MSPPLLDGKAFGAPNDIKSSFPCTCGPFEPDSSCNFLDCSVSTRADMLLISSMNNWNCWRFNKGPRLMLHKMGRTSMATNSASTIPPTWRKTFNAAIATAGSLVLIARIRGTIFSCIVYLSKAVDELFLLAFAFITPSSPSLLAVGSLPPQRITNASNPRTLIPRLLVLLKTEAIIGNNSFLMVEKSMTGRITGKLLKEASTML